MSRAMVLAEPVLSADAFAVLWTIDFCSKDKYFSCGFQKLVMARADDGLALDYDRAFVVDELVAAGLVEERNFVGMIEFVITPAGREVLERDTPNHPLRRVVNGMVIVES